MASTALLRLLPGRRRTAIVLVLAAVTAVGSGAEAASLSLSWNAPSTNADGTPLTDLAGYRVYIGTTLPACPSASFHSVSSPTTRPGFGQTVSTIITALGAGTTYVVRITAIDTGGNESACSGAATGVARAGLAVTPSATSNFGSVTIGGTADRTFTVQNTSAASTSVAVSAGAPFSIASTPSFSLAAGASRAVTVRFRPTIGGGFASNVTFTAGGETVSRGVSGSGTAASGPATASGPVARTLSPSRVIAGRAGLTLTVDGSGFVASSVVRWRGANRATKFVSAKRLRVAIPASDLATPGSVPVSVVTPSAGGGTSAAVIFTIATPPPRPPTPGPVSVKRPKATAAAALFTVAWAKTSEAKSYRYVVVFNDGSATVSGTVKARSFRLRMPYHVSGAAAGARVCIRSVNAAGQRSVGQSCGAVSVPARPAAPASSPATPQKPVVDWGWGVG